MISSGKHTSQTNSSPLPSSSTRLILKHREVLAFGFLCLSPYLYLLFFSNGLRQDFRQGILLNLGMSVLAFLATIFFIPIVSTYVMKRDLFGYDLNKKGTPGGLVKIPESMGLVSGMVYIVITIAFQRFYITQNSSQSPLSLQEVNAALASICFMLLLGFVDDVLDIPWRLKLFLPSSAAMLLMMAYSGGTTILIPKPFSMWLGVTLLDLGWIYKLCVGFLVVFCTNAVNIFAGINGLEAGQTIVIACSALTYNLINILAASVNHYADQHIFSIYLTQPLVAVSLGLLSYNWYPSSVFVGDSFTYFAGMTIAVVAIFGHFSETLVFLMLPQVLNFLYSLPQLLKILPCPRHRLPRFDPQSGLLIGKSDMTLVNLFLRLFGCSSEYHLFIKLMVFQAICCVSAILSQVNASTGLIENPRIFRSVLTRIQNIMISVPQIIIFIWSLVMFIVSFKKSHAPLTWVEQYLEKQQLQQAFHKFKQEYSGVFGGNEDDLKGSYIATIVGSGQNQQSSLQQFKLWC